MLVYQGGKFPKDDINPGTIFLMKTEDINLGDAATTDGHLHDRMLLQLFGAEYDKL